MLGANQAIVANLPVPDLLRRTAQAACELAHARYGAFGLSDPAGGLEQFVYVGVDEDTAADIGHLPKGEGLLGVPTRVDVDVATTTAELSMDVVDDGVGIRDAARRTGLASLGQRAEQHGGSLILAAVVPGDSQSTPRGTRLSWMIPLS